MTCNACAEWVEITDLRAPHVVRTCPKCSRQANLRPPGEHGIGIKVEKGDKFVFPAEFIQIAANPLKGTGHLTRYGLTWFADLVFGGGTLVRKRDDVAGAIKEFMAESENQLGKIPSI